ncbi:MAG: hypothetical protein JXD22_04895 [Sedimentisphaerales bacterium]|nr:hypothetical protein [Sedimentisphaerales bacterium]
MAEVRIQKEEGNLDARPAVLAPVAAGQVGHDKSGRRYIQDVGEEWGGIKKEWT